VEHPSVKFLLWLFFNITFGIYMLWLVSERENNPNFNLVIAIAGMLYIAGMMGIKSERESSRARGINPIKTDRRLNRLSMKHLLLGFVLVILSLLTVSRLHYVEIPLVKSLCYPLAVFVVAMLLGFLATESAGSVGQSDPL
jgi:hypothetical protein